MRVALRTAPGADTIRRSISRDSYRRDLVNGVSTTFNDTDVDSLSYSNDALYRPTSRNEDTFAYNERGEVVFSRRAESAEDTYAYDGIGNLQIAAFNSVTNTYAANSLNQYTSILRAPAPLHETSHDVDGNMTSDCVFSYAYDAANRLASVSSNGITLVANQYDYRGRRIRKTTSTAETTFVYDGWNLVYEREVADDVTNETFYCWGNDLSGTLQGAGGVGGLLYLKRNGAIYVPHADANGNIVRYTDTVGNVVAEYTYDAFGKTIAQSGPMAEVFQIRFSSKYYDSETGLYYYGYRFYSPALMRWLNRDPIEEDGGLNLYGFCGNAAIYSHDSQGLQATFDIKITPIRVGIILSTKNHKSSYPRAATSHGGDLKFSCDKDCRIKVSGKLSLKIEMLDRGNIRWNKSFPQYRDSAFVSEDLNTYNHELDHFYTWNDFYAFLKTANSYDGRFYKDCNAKALDLQIRYSRFKSKVQQHSSSFDQDGRNMGGQYSRHPLDMSKFNWE